MPPPSLDACTQCNPRLLAGQHPCDRIRHRRGYDTHHPIHPGVRAEHPDRAGRHGVRRDDPGPGRRGQQRRARSARSGVGLMPAPALTQTIAAIRAGTAEPFNVNFITVFTEQAQIDAVCAAGVAVASFHWGHPPRAWIDQLHAAGVRVFEQVGSVTGRQAGGRRRGGRGGRAGAGGGRAQLRHAADLRAGAAGGRRGGAGAGAGRGRDRRRAGAGGGADARRRRRLDRYPAGRHHRVRRPRRVQGAGGRGAGPPTPCAPRCSGRRRRSSTRCGCCATGWSAVAGPAGRDPGRHVGAAGDRAHRCSAASRSRCAGSPIWYRCAT